MGWSASDEKAEREGAGSSASVPDAVPISPDELVDISDDEIDEHIAAANVKDISTAIAVLRFSHKYCGIIFIIHAKFFCEPCPFTLNCIDKAVSRVPVQQLSKSVIFCGSNFYQNMRKRALAVLLSP